MDGFDDFDGPPEIVKIDPKPTFGRTPQKQSILTILGGPDGFGKGVKFGKKSILGQFFTFWGSLPPKRDSGKWSKTPFWTNFSLFGGTPQKSEEFEKSTVLGFLRGYPKNEGTPQKIEKGPFLGFRNNFWKS